jgi:general secretion pathway protein J
MGARAGAGFTLIELLVALTLLGLVSVVLFGGLRFGTRAWEVGNARAERLAEVQAVQAVLRRRIAQAVLPEDAGAESAFSDSPAAFAGEEDSLRFVALVPSRIGVGGFYLFELSVADDGDGARLELAWRLFRPDQPGDLDEPEPGLGGRRVLIEGIEEAKFGYYGAEPAGAESEWRERWDGADGLPALIVIEVAFPSGDARSWPDLVVAPRLAATPPGR